MILLAALCTAGAVAIWGWRTAHPRRAPARRIAPYTEVARSRLGVKVDSLPQPVVVGQAARRVLGPLASGGLRWANQVLRVAEASELNLRLRQAGNPMTAEMYRRRHLRWALGAPVGFAIAGAVAGSTLLVVVFMVLGLVGGVRLMPDHLRRLTRQRAARIRSDLPTVAGMLSPKIENAKSLAVAFESLVTQGSGPVIEDLARAVHATAAGVSLADAFEMIAREAVDPAAARFYRFLAAATTGGIDLPKALLNQADELRAQRREEVERSAARRQMSMVIPNVALMAPVMILFLLAPIPQMLFGR